jgi:hypothetical protein
MWGWVLRCTGALIQEGAEVKRRIGMEVERDVDGCCMEWDREKENRLHWVRIWMCFYIWCINRSVHNFSIFRRLGSIYCIEYFIILDAGDLNPVFWGLIIQFHQDQSAGINLPLII